MEESVEMKMRKKKHVMQESTEIDRTFLVFPSRQDRSIGSNSNVAINMHLMMFSIPRSNLKSNHRSYFQSENHRPLLPSIHKLLPTVTIHRQRRRTKRTVHDRSRLRFLVKRVH